MPNRALEELEQFAIEVILEKRQGFRANLLRGIAWTLSGFYSRIARWRWALYENRMLPGHAVGCPILSVGNLTVGGTGKTPVVELFARVLSQHGRRVAILSRGYKSVPRPLYQRLWARWIRGEGPTPPRIVSDGKSLLLDSERAGDEPFMLASNLRDVVVLVDKNRVKSAAFAVEQFGTDFLILDDGYQYFPLKERINLALVDRHQPFGNEFVLPRGTLREPRDHLKRADVILITKCDGSDLTDLKKRLRQFNRHAEIIECRHRPRYLQNILTGERQDLSTLRGLPVGAVSGIAIPESFEDGLRKLGAELIYTRAYADHHRFTPQEILNAINRTRARGGHALITTEKDAVRFPRVDSRDLPVFFLRVEIELQTKDESTEACVLRLCGLSPPPSAVLVKQESEPMAAPI
ncbi:MAG: tetraacyldisaccharide 4'-kinase [Candidatus Methylacidiphilales bacterium]